MKRFSFILGSAAAIVAASSAQAIAWSKYTIKVFGENGLLIETLRGSMPMASTVCGTLMAYHKQGCPNARISPRDLRLMDRRPCCWQIVTGCQLKLGDIEDRPKMFPNIHLSPNDSLSITFNLVHEA